MKTSEYKYHKYSFEQFNPLQAEVLASFDPTKNLVVSAPTSSGKTICGELLAGVYLKKRKKIIYLSPMKALAEEKLREWSDKEHPWHRYRKEIMTGDYRIDEDKKEALNKAHIIISTYEMLSVRCRNEGEEQNHWMTKTGALIVDEAHFLSADGRGDHLENALILFTQINPTARLVLLSATMTNYEEISAWISNLRQDKTITINSTYRPCPLTLHFLPYKVQAPKWERYQAEEAAKVDQIVTLLRNDALLNDQWLIFVHSKTMGNQLYRELKSTFQNTRVGYHNADLSKSDRERLETLFLAGGVRILIATSTLAYGLNLPARRVAIVGLERGLNDVDPLDVIQECGRAGRPKFDSCGDAYIILNEDKLKTWDSFLSKGIDVKSRFQNALGFHLIGEIVEKRVKTKEMGREWLKRTFSVHQNLSSPEAIDNIFDIYEGNGLIIDLDKQDKQGVVLSETGYRATPLGVIASKNYFDPVDVVFWKNNLFTVNSKNLQYNDAAVAWMIANVPTRTGFIPKDLRLAANDLLSQLRGFSMYFCGDGQLMAGMVLHYQMQGNINMIMPSAMSVKMSLIYDIERILNCISQIATRILSKRDRIYWEKLTYRILHGIGWEEADLCRMDGIGSIYSGRLHGLGIKSVEEFLRKGSIAKDILPKQVFAKALYSARTLTTGGWQ